MERFDLSIQAMAWAIEQQLVTDAPGRHVLLCLSNYASVDGRGCFPSTATLASDTGLAERTVRSKLDLLQAMGLIRLGNQALAAVNITRADRRPLVYDIVLPGPRGAADAPRSNVDNSVDKEGASCG
jgi:hypothetical protein